MYSKFPRLDNKFANQKANATLQQSLKPTSFKLNYSDSYRGEGSKFAPDSQVPKLSYKFFHPITSILPARLTNDSPGSDIKSESRNEVNVKSLGHSETSGSQLEDHDKLNKSNHSVTDDVNAAHTIECNEMITRQFRDELERQQHQIEASRPYQKNQQYTRQGEDLENTLPLLHTKFDRNYGQLEITRATLKPKDPMNYSAEKTIDDMKTQSSGRWSPIKLKPLRQKSLFEVSICSIKCYGRIQKVFLSIQYNFLIN